MIVPFAGKLALWLPLTPQPVDIGADMLGLMLPWYQASVDAWVEGELPLWNPLEGLGRPLNANPQAASFYPNTLLLALLSGGRLTLTWLELSVLWHLALAAVGVYLLARVLGLRRGPAWLAGAAFTGAGLFLNVLPSHSMVAAAAWVPWAIAASIKAFERGGWRWTAPAALCLALSLLAGHPQPCFYAALLIGIIAISRAIGDSSPRPLIKLVVIGALALAIAAPQVMPAHAAMPELFRGGDWRRVTLKPEMFPVRFLSIAAPQIGIVSGLAAAGILFFGSVPLILAPVGARERALRLRGTLLICFLTFLVLAHAEELMIDNALAAAVPGYGMFKDHYRAALIVNLLGALLAGAGLQRLRNGADRSDRRLAVAVAAIIVCVQAGLLVAFPAAWQRWRFSVYALVAIAAVASAATAVLLSRRFPRAALIMVTVIALSELLLLTNTNNLRPRIRDKMRDFALQASVIPRGVAPPRVRREMLYFWTNLDTYNGLNAFRAEDPNQFVAFRRLWRAAEARPLLERQWGARYWITGRSISQSTRPTSNIRLDRHNRLQRYPLPEAASGRRLHLRLSVEPNEEGRARAAAIVNTDDGRVLAVPLETLGIVTWEDGSVRHRLGGSLTGIRLQRRPMEVWVELIEGRSARLQSMRFSQEDLPLRLPPRVRALGHGVYDFTDALPRAMLVAGVERCASADEMLARLRQPVDLEEQVLLLDRDAPPGPTRHWSAEEAVAAGAEIVRYSRHRVAIRTVAPRESYLVLSDFFHPGWSATVDGEPAEILRANFCARAVNVPAGVHTIEFSYSEPTAVAAIAISLAALVLCLIAVAWQRRPAPERPSN